VRGKWWFTIGAACGLVIGVLVGKLVFQSRFPSWNEKALVVVWSEAGETLQIAGQDVKHSGYNLVFGLQNNIGRDITIPTDVAIMKRLTKGKTLTEYPGVKLGEAFFVPAHQTAKLSIWLDRNCSIEDLVTGAVTQRDPRTCFNEEFGDSEGLVLFDHQQRIQINLPTPKLNLK
jgi:hypothetical protein